MKKSSTFIGCFVSTTIGDVRGSEFRNYIFGKNGLVDKFEIIEQKRYGNDLEVILFQFYVNPEIYLLQNLKEIENYRKKEKAIGIPIIITESNFFQKQESEKFSLLKQMILEKLNKLFIIAHKKKLDGCKSLRYPERNHLD